MRRVTVVLLSLVLMRPSHPIGLAQQCESSGAEPVAVSLEDLCKLQCATIGRIRTLAVEAEFELIRPLPKMETRKDQWMFTPSRERYNTLIGWKQLPFRYEYRDLSIDRTARRIHSLRWRHSKPKCPKLRNCKEITYPKRKSNCHRWGLMV